MSKNKNVEAYISEKAGAEQKPLLQQLRDLIHDAVPGIQEDIKWGQPTFSKEKQLCYFKAQKNNIRFGFFDASSLNDPDNLLEGTGKKMRHVKITSKSDIDKERFKQWLQTLAD